MHRFYSEKIMNGERNLLCTYERFLVQASIFTGTSVVDTINLGLGKILY